MSAYNMPERFTAPLNECVDCGCCAAEVPDGSGIPGQGICFRCDEGTHPTVADEDKPASPPPAPAPEPEPERTPASIPEPFFAFCAGGCGTSLPSGKRQGFVYGHKHGCKPARAKAATANLILEPEPEEVTEPEPFVESNVILTLSETQMNRLWMKFSPEEKAFAILAGLDASITPVADTEA